MGQLNEKFVGVQKNPVALHDMFNPEKLAQLSCKLRKISFNGIADNNGLVFQDKLISKELLVKILDYIDYKSLIVCQLVCKQWLLLIRRYVWRRKAERLFQCYLPDDKKALWTIFYASCDKKIPFGKNLIKFGSDEDPSKKFWRNMTGEHDTWHYQKKLFKAPKLDPTFDRTSVRIVIGKLKCWKQQIIYLLNEDFPQYILDNVKPIIKVSEWYRCQRDSAAGIYECKIELVKVEEKVNMLKYVQFKDDLVDSYNFKKTFENRNHRGTWRKFKYQFRNYGKGLNKIIFYHGGQGHIEIGATCITLEFPHKRN